MGTIVTTRALRPEVVEAHQYAGTAVIVDVRGDDELWRDGWIAGAVHAQADPGRGLDPTTPVIVVSGAGRRAAEAAEALADRGFADVAYLAGGMRAWTARGLPVAGLASWHTGPSRGEGS